MYYYRDGTLSVGPFSAEKLAELYQKGLINAQTLIRAENADAWFEYGRFAAQPQGESFSTGSTHSAPESVTPPPVPGNWALAPIAPWRRYFARLFDVTIFGILAWALIGYGWYRIAPLQADAFFNQLNRLFDTILTLLLGSVVSGLVLGFVGTTPGKTIFGVRVRTLDGKPIGAMNGLSRDFTIFIKGFGLGIPLVSFVTLILSYLRLNRDKVMSWDQGQYTVTYRPNTGAQIMLSIAGILLYAVILGMIAAIGELF